MNTKIPFSRLAALLAIVLALAVGCTSDPDTPLGTQFQDDGLIGSDFGPVSQDTIIIADGDTSFVTNSTQTGAGALTLGLKDGFKTTMLLRVDFTAPGDDTLKTVDRAELRLKVTSATLTDSTNARFFELLDPFSEGDTLTSVMTATDPIPDEDLVEVDRSMLFAVSRYSLPTALVQSWIRGSATHNGIAVVLADPSIVPEDEASWKELFYGARTDTENLPFLKVFFTDGDESTYHISDDGTFIEDLTPRVNLIISDGVIRRTWIPVDLSAYDPELILHDARLVFSIVDGSSSGGNLAASVYAPTSSTIGDPGLLDGTLVSTVFIDTSATEVFFPIRTIIEQFVGDPASNHGLVVRMASEGSSIRQVEFHTGSAEEALRPRLNFTISEAPRFPR